MTPGSWCLHYLVYTNYLTIMYEADGFKKRFMCRIELMC